MRNFFLRHMNNRKGFSIVQVIISMGLLSGLIVVGFKMIESQTRVGKSSSFYFESLHIVDEIKSILSNKKACALSLENKSAYFESIQNIFSVDNDSVAEVEYRVHKDGIPRYGQSNLIIEKMELNGNSPELGTEKGITILKIFFSENSLNSDLFSFEIPVHIKVSEMGRIESCFTLSGIDGGASSNSDSSLWVKKTRDDQRKVLSANSSSVIIGKQRRNNSSALSISGGLKVGDSETCDEERSGLLKFSKKDHAYSWCNEQGQWESLSKSSPLINEFKEFNISHNQSDVKTVVTENDFRFCQVHETNYNSGVCWVRPIKTNELISRWELVSQYLRGDQVKCSFRCFR